MPPLLGCMAVNDMLCAHFAATCHVICFPAMRCNIFILTCGVQSLGIDIDARIRSGLEVASAWLEERRGSNFEYVMAGL